MPLLCPGRWSRRPWPVHLSRTTCSRSWNQLFLRWFFVSFTHCTPEITHRTHTNKLYPQAGFSSPKKKGYVVQGYVVQSPRLPFYSWLFDRDHGEAIEPPNFALLPILLHFMWQCEKHQNRILCQQAEFVKKVSKSVMSTLKRLLLPSLYYSWEPLTQNPIQRLLFDSRFWSFVIEQIIVAKDDVSILHNVY